MIEKDFINPLWVTSGIARKDKITDDYYPEVPAGIDELDDDLNSSLGYIEKTSWAEAVKTGGKKLEKIWNLEEYNFLNELESHKNIHPTLLRMEKMNNKSGLFLVTPTPTSCSLKPSEVHEGTIFQIRSYDVSTMSFVKSDHGWVVIDPLTSNETAKAGLDMFCKMVDKDAADKIKAVLITHSHVDHYKGLGGILGSSKIMYGVVQKDFENEISHSINVGEVLVVAPNGFYDEAISENLYLGNCMSRRAMYMYGSLLPRNVCGTVGAGLGKSVGVGSGILYQPSFEIVQPVDKEFVTLYIDGLAIDFQDVPNTEAPAEFHIYIRKYKALCPGENVTHTMHNLLTSRGAKVRDSKAFGHAIDKSIDLFGDLECIIGNHHWPTWGNKQCIHLMESQRDMYLFFNDQVIRYLNKGMNMEEIAEHFHLPDSLYNKYYNFGYYGTINHNVKAVVQGYIGWWDGNPANYFKYPEEETAVRWVETMGGAGQVLAKALLSFVKRDYRWTVELTKQIIFSKADKLIVSKAAHLQADALEQLGYSFGSGTWRNIFLAAAQDLRMPFMGTMHSKREDAIEEMYQTILGLSPDYIFEYLAVMLDADKIMADQKELEKVNKGCRDFEIFFSDLDIRLRINFKNCVLHHVRASKDYNSADEVLTYKDVVDFAEDLRDCLNNLETSSSGLLWMSAHLDFHNKMWNIVMPLNMEFS